MSNTTGGMTPRPQMQDLRRLLPPELQTASPEEQLNYLKGLVSRNQNGGQAVGSPQVRPSPRPRPPQNFAAGVNNIQAVPGGTGGTSNINAGARPAPNPASAAFIHRLCTQAGINLQQFQSMNQQQQQAFLTTQANIMRQQTSRAQGGNGGGTPNPLGAAAAPGIGRPQQQAQGSPAMPALQAPPIINGMNAQHASQLPAGSMQNQAQAAAALTAAAAGNNPALQARLLQMRAQGHAIPQGLQNQLAAAVQNVGQGGNMQGGGQGTNGMMGQLPQTQGTGNQNGPAMNNQSPHVLPNSLPSAQQGPAQNTVFPGLPNGPGTPGTVNGLNAANGSSPGEQQRAFQEIQNILANLPEFMKMKDENRLNEQQMKMLDHIVKIKGPGFFQQQQINRSQQAATQLQAQRQLHQQNQQQQRQQSLGTPGQPQENLTLHAHQQHALYRQLQNMQQHQMLQANGNMDSQQIPNINNQNGTAMTPRPPALGLNGQGVATPNSQGTSSPVTMNTPVSMGTPSGSTTGSATAAMAFKKIEDMSDEKRNQFFKNTPPIRRSYFTHIRGLPEEQRRELFTRKPAISSAYQEYIREVNMQQLRNAQQARASPLHANALPYNAGPTTMASPVVNNQILNVNDASLNNTPGQMPGSLPVPLPNLQLPANRQRLLNQAQARQAQPGPGGSIPNGLQQSGQMPLMGMNPQMQQVQNQMTAATAAQVAAFKAQVQNQASLPLGVSQSPRSLQGTPQIGQNAVLPSNVRAGTPNRVASLAGNGLASRQGSINGSPQLNSSPGMANTNIMSGMSLPSNGMLAMSGVTQAMSQQQLQAQLAQIGQQAQAQLQANMQNQGQGQLGMPLSLPGAPVGNQMLRPGMMPPPMPVGSQGLLPPGMLPPGLGGPLNQSQAAQMAQMQARGRPMGFPAPNAIQQQQQQQQQGQSVECPPVSVDVQISQVLPASVNTLPSMTRYPDTKPLHTSLTGGLAAGMTLGLPPHLQRPPSMGRYLAQFQRETAMSGVGKLAMKGTIFEKLKSISKDGDEAEDDVGTTVSVVDPVVKEEKAVVPAVTEEGIAEASTSPKTSKRKLADLAEDLYPRVEISEAAEDVLLELADEFIDSCIEFGCRLAKHRKARKLEVQDIQFHLGREYDINIPGFSSDAIRMDRLRNELKSAATSGAGPNGGMRAQRLAAVAQARAQLRQQVKAAKVAAAAVTSTTTTAPTGDVHTETSLPPTQSKIVVKT